MNIENSYDETHTHYGNDCSVKDMSEVRTWGELMALLEPLKMTCRHGERVVAETAIVRNGKF